MSTRREFIRLGLPTVIGLAGCVQAPLADNQAKRGIPSLKGDLPLELETITDRPDAPLAFEYTDTGILYIGDRDGQIYQYSEKEIETALDISDEVLTGGERGLLCLKSHPNFASNGRLYVRYSSDSSDVPSSYSHMFILAEFQVHQSGRVLRDSERVILEIPEPKANHNSGAIEFGRDGYLYIGVGDGGGAQDSGLGHVEDWYDPIKGGNGQDYMKNFHGSILRIDVDSREAGKPYAIPDDNPLVGRPGLDEHYAWGLRNPWGISFDGDDLYVADVGQAFFEEVNLVEKGRNYGWNVREGTHCFRQNKCPATTSDGTELRDPIIEYPHPDTEDPDSNATVSGIAVVGGHVYRGNAVPALSGKYVFGDLSPQGRLFAATPTEEGLWPIEEVEIADSSKEKLGKLFAIGRDRNEELYALTASGVHRLLPTR